MRKELVPDEAPMSTKKRKRLDAYIAKKLKQEEMHESLRIIAANALASSSGPSDSQVPTGLSTLGIKSTKTLGQFPTNPLSAFELAERREDLTVRKAMAGVPGGDQRKKGRRARKGAYENMDNDDEEDISDEDDGESGSEAAVQPTEEDERAVKKRKKAERNGIVVSASSASTLAMPGKKKSAKKASGGGSIRVKVCYSTSSTLCIAILTLFQQSDAPPKPSTADKADSSDFDSSDSENDAPVKQESPSAAPSAPFAKQKVQTGAAPTTSSALQTSFTPVATTGSALRKGPNGEVLGPRIVERKPKIKVCLLLRMRY